MTVASRVLRKSPSAKVRRVAARTLGRLDGAGVAISLARHLENEPNAEVKREMVMLLGRLARPQTGAAVASCFREARVSGKLRDELIATLGKLRETEVVPDLAEIAASPQENPRTRALAVCALGEIALGGWERKRSRFRKGKPGEEDPWEKALETLLAASYSAVREVRREAATCLGWFTLPDCQRELERLALDPGDVEVRWRALRSLSGMRDKKFLDMFCERTRDIAAKAREEAVRGLRKLVEEGDLFPEEREKVWKVVRSLIAEEQAPEVRIEVISLAVSLAGVQAREIIFQFLEDPLREVRLRAVKALGELRDPLAWAELEGIWEKDPDRYVRLAVLRNLRQK